MSGMFIVLEPITSEIFTPQKPQTTNGSISSVTEQIIFVLFQHSVFSPVNNCFSFLFVYSIEYRFEWYWNILEGITKVELFTLHYTSTCWILSVVFPVCWSCNQGTSGDTVVWMFNSLPTYYSKLNHLVLQKILAGILLSEMKTSRFFTFTVFMWNILTWKLVVVAFASKFFLSKIARCGGCSPQHCSWGTCGTVF